MDKTAERDERLQHAIDRIKNLDDSMKVNLKGKKYTMVAQRVQAFREAFGCGANITTEIVVCDDAKVIVKASVSVQRDGAWVPIATEFAEEYRGVGPVNKTSALENCCTSSIGRALAACGLSGGEYASSFEVDNAINNKPEAPAKPKEVAPPVNKVEEKSDDLEEWVSKNDKPKAPVPDNTDTPVTPENADEIVDAFLAIASKCQTVQELYDLWKKNPSKIDEIDEKAPASYSRLKASFTEMKKKIEEKKNG